MRCLYEVLEVARDAEAGDIKTAYRKAALRWHPDKNQDDLERASARFKEIQNAYEVLSDRQERSWYDNHRDAILRGGESGQGGSQYQAGGDGVGGGQPPDSDFDLFPYFSATCFSGYGGGEKGFYAVYDDVFSRLAENELDEGSVEARSGGGGGGGGGGVAAAAAARASLRERRFPSFGGADTPWEQVSKFYDCWGPGFATSKSFAWCDEYNPASAPSRKVRRLVEEANRKKRSKAKREFNETVRALAAFVRRRDRRAVAAAAAAAAKRAAAAEAEAQRRSAEKVARAARAAAYREQMEHEGGEEDERGGGGGGRGSGGGSDDTESSEEEELVLLECVACNKRFRSEAAFSNHERSRKHSEAVAALRAALAEEEAALASSSSGCEGEEEESEEEESSSSSSSGGGSGGGASTSGSSSSSSSSPSEDDNDDDDEDAPINLTEFATRLSRNGGGGNGRSGRKKPPAPAESDDDDGGDEEEEEEGEEATVTAGASADDVADALKDKATLDEPEEKEETAPEPATTKLGRAKEKKKKKAEAAAAAAAAEKQRSQGNTCRECGDRFLSRTKLLNHLSETGHK